MPYKITYENNVINSEQHELRCGKSCFTNFLEIFEDMYRAVDEKRTSILLAVA